MESGWEYLALERTYAASELLAAHPPRFQHPNKTLVFAIASPRGAVHRGTIRLTQWRAMPLPQRIKARAPGSGLEVRQGYYTYDVNPEPTRRVEWHQNFADRSSRST